MEKLQIEKLLDCKSAVDSILAKVITPDNSTECYKLMQIECDKIQAVLVEILTTNWNTPLKELKLNFYGNDDEGKIPSYFDDCYIQALLQIKKESKKNLNNFLNQNE